MDKIGWKFYLVFMACNLVDFILVSFACNLLCSRWALTITPRSRFSSLRPKVNLICQLELNYDSKSYCQAKVSRRWLRSLETRLTFKASFTSMVSKKGDTVSTSIRIVTRRSKKPDKSERVSSVRVVECSLYMNTHHVPFVHTSILFPSMIISLVISWLPNVIFSVLEPGAHYNTWS